MRPIPPFALSSRSSAAAQQEEHEEEDEEQTSAEEGEGQTPQLIQEEYEEEQAAEEQEEVEQQTPPLITPAKAKAGRGRPRKVKKEPLPADSHEDDGDEQQQQEEEQTPQEVGEQQTPLITPAKAKAGRGQPKKVGNDGDEQPPEIEEIETPTLEKLSKERLQAREEKEARLAEKKRRNEEKEELDRQKRNEKARVKKEQGVEGEGDEVEEEPNLPLSRRQSLNRTISATKRAIFSPPVHEHRTRTVKMRGRKKKKTIKKSHRAEAATDSAADEDVDNMHVYHEEDGAEWQFLDVVQDEKKLAWLVRRDTMVALRPPPPNCQTTTRYVCRKANFADGFCQRQLLLVRSTHVKAEKADSDEEEKQAPKQAAPQQQEGKVAKRLGMMYFRNYHKSTELDEELTFPVAPDGSNADVTEKPDGWEKKGPGPIDWGTRFNHRGSDNYYLHIGDIFYDEQFRAFQRENTLDFVKFKQTGEADFHARSGKSRLALYKCKWGRDPEDPQNDDKRRCPFTSYLVGLRELGDAFFRLYVGEGVDHDHTWREQNPVVPAHAPLTQQRKAPLPPQPQPQPQQLPLTVHELLGPCASSSIFRSDKD